MKQFIKCGKLFTGNAMANGPGDQYLVVEGGSITHAGSLSPACSRDRATLSPTTRASS